MKKILIVLVLSLLFVNLFAVRIFAQENINGPILALNPSPQSNQSANLTRNEFELRGKITSERNNTFMVLNRVITTDPTKVKNFIQLAPITKGKTIKVDGIKVDTILLAESIMPFNDSINESNVSYGILIDKTNKTFEAKGTVGSVSKDSFNVFGQEIIYGSSKSNIRLAENQIVQINGTINDGFFTAKNIYILEDKTRRGPFELARNVWNRIIASTRNLLR